MSPVTVKRRDLARSADTAVIEVPIKVSVYDRVSGLLIALLMLVGGSVAVLLLAWLMTRIVFRPGAKPIEFVENVAVRGDHAPGFARDLEAPGDEELSEFREPQPQTSLEAVTDAVSTIVATTDWPDYQALVNSKGARQMGDSRGAGPLGEGDDIIPRWERWEIRWSSGTLSAYAQQLDYFKIELGAIGGGRNEVDYAFRLAQSRPGRRSGASQDEKRLYMTWKGGTLQQFDQQLLERAGIGTANRTMMHFYPGEVENSLAAVEMEHARKQGHGNVKEIQRTVFGVRPAGLSYEFHVIDQRYRSPAG